MNNNINIAKILRDCPKGIKLYSPLFGNITFEEVDISSTVSIQVKCSSNRQASFYETGLYYDYKDAECLLFPSSEIRDWSKFFKRGDIVITNRNDMAAVFDGWANDTYTKFHTTINIYCNNNPGEQEVCDTLLFRKATEEECKRFIKKAEILLKGKYNPETLQVEPIKSECPFKPFDKVLVRDASDGIWFPAYFAYYKYGTSYPYACMDSSYRYCIHYEGNEHLLGTTNPYIKNNE